MEHSPLVLTGASGLIGGALRVLMESAGRTVAPLSVRQGVDAAAIDGAGAVVHLAGENIGARWSEARKQAIRDSRVRSSEQIAQAIARAKSPPRVLVCASAVGYYGTHADAPCDEESPAGEGFLAELCRDWEAACAPAAKVARVVNVRFGVVLSSRGGALAKMLTPFRLALGGRIGAGTQPFPWIAIDDAVAAIARALDDPSLRGPVNLVAPARDSNASFTKALARALHRPAFLPLPAAMVRLAFGEMGESALLSGVEVVPRKLERIGFQFRFPTLDAALAHLLSRASSAA
jgi:uncharacterized protein (TIGR01777 family)